MSSKLPAAYTSAGMESEPRVLSLDILLVAFSTSAWLGSSARELMIGT